MKYEKYLKGQELVEFEKMLSLLREHEKELEKEKDPQKAQLWLLVFYLYKKVEKLEKRIKDMEDKREFLRNVMKSQSSEEIKKILKDY